MRLGFLLNTPILCDYFLCKIIHFPATQREANIANKGIDCYTAAHTVVDNWKLIFCYFSFHVAVTLATKAIYIFCRLRLQCFNLPQNPEFCFFVQIHRFIVGRMRNDSVCTEKPEKSCCCCCCVLWGRLPDHRRHSSQFSHCVHRPRTNDSSFTGLRDEKPKKKTDTKNQEAKSVLCCGRRKSFYAFLTGYTNISEYTSPRSVARHHVHAFWLNGRLSLCAFVCAEKMLFDAWRAHLFARLIIISCAHIAGCRLENWQSNLLVQRCRTYERIHAQHGTRQQP